MVVAVSNIDNSGSENSVSALSDPSYSRIAQDKHLIHNVALDPALSCLKCKDSNSVLWVIDSKTIITVGRDTFSPKLLMIKSLKSLKAMSGKGADCGLAMTCGIKSDTKNNRAN